MSYARFEGGSMVEVGREIKESRRRAGSQDDQPPEEWFVGQVKSYAPQQGYGFIECQDTFARYKSDVFLHKNQVENGPKRIAKGDTVRFSVEVKSGRPQARNLQRHVSFSVPRDKTFVGRVKAFSTEKGFGFIACDDTRNIFNSDIFLHKIQFDTAGLEQGCLATFTVEVNAKGRPQARNVARYTPDSFTESVTAEEVEAFVRD